MIKTAIIINFNLKSKKIGITTEIIFFISLVSDSIENELNCAHLVLVDAWFYYDHKKK